LNGRETRKEIRIKEDKYIYYRTKIVRIEASEPNETKKTGLMMEK
jgi:hypothetical protein